MPRAFDERELLERIDNDWEFLSETVQMLGEDGPTLMEEIRSAVQRGDAPAVGRAAHTLKGMISNFCAPQAQASAFDVERIGKSGDLSAAHAAVGSLQKDLDGLVTDLTALLATRR